MLSREMRHLPFFLRNQLHQEEEEDRGLEKARKRNNQSDPATSVRSGTALIRAKPVMIANLGSLRLEIK